MRRLRIPSLLLLTTAAFLPTLAHAQKVVAWGDNRSGILNVPAGLVATQMSVSAFSAIALRPDGTVAAWGDSSLGQLNVPAGLLASQISGGAYHEVALCLDGTVAAWGYNNYNQTNVPAGLVATKIAAGTFHTLALRPDGTVAAWGANDFGQCDVPTGLLATQTAGGLLHSLALRPDGTVVSWGNNSYGELNVPVGLVATALSAGGGFSLALRRDGTVVGWGDNVAGQCDIPAGLIATEISAGINHSLALRPDGTVAAWGLNRYGETTVPAGLTGVLQVSASQYISMALVAAAHALLDQTEVFAGGSATGKVKLASPASAEGIVVGLVSSDPSVTVPATVTVFPGQTERTFPVTTATNFAGDRVVTIQTTYNGTATVPARLKVKGAALVLGFSVPSLIGGSTTKPALNLTVAATAATDRVFSLSSSDPSVTVPATVTMPAGQTSAKVVLPFTARVTSPTTATVTAADGGSTVASASLTINPLRASVVFNSPTLPSGESAAGSLTLNAASALAMTVPLASGDPSVVVPASVTVKAGAKTAFFPISTSPVSTTRLVPVTANVTGNPFSGNLRLLAAPGVKSLTLPASMYGNAVVSGTVRLTMAAKAGGTVVQLSSSDPALAVHTTVTVPEGQYAVAFLARSSDVAALTNATVTASAGPSSATAGLSVKPLVLAGLTVSPTTATSGSTVTLSVKLAKPAGTDTVVALTSADPTLVPVLSSIVVPAGSQTASITFDLGSIALTKYVRITASKPGSSLYRTLKIAP